MDKSIIDKIQNKKPLSREEFKIIVANTDWGILNERVLWGLNEPRCSCDGCYTSWLEYGKKLYSSQPELYEQRKIEALAHKEQKQISRKIRDLEIETRYCG